MYSSHTGRMQGGGKGGGEGEHTHLVWEQEEAGEGAARCESPLACLSSQSQTRRPPHPLELHTVTSSTCHTISQPCIGTVLYETCTL